MSRKSSTPNQKAQPSAPAGKPPVADGSRRGLFIAATAGLFIASSLGGLYWFGTRRSSTEQVLAQRPELASAHAPSMGEASAKVHIVEFLDPACETCAVFYPLVKQMLADNPGRIRLSTRHVPFHKGADEVVRMLEASRVQGQYWRVLETLLSSQAQWVPNHVADPQRALLAISGVGMDMDKLQADMRAPDVAQRMQQDQQDATALDVKATPEYFVNGRQMESFGRQQLQSLVRNALAAAY